MTLDRKRFRSNEIGIPTPNIVIGDLCCSRRHDMCMRYIILYTYIQTNLPTIVLLYIAVCRAPRFWNRNTRVILFLKIYTYYTLGWFLFWFIKTVNTHFVIHTRLPCRRTAHHAIHIIYVYYIYIIHTAEYTHGYFTDGRAHTGDTPTQRRHIHIIFHPFRTVTNIL